MKVVVIVVTYNGAKWVNKCFSSLIQSAIPLKILAIDNASTDNTVLLIKEFFPSVELIETGINLGFGKANNIGFRKALRENADYVFLLNQDAWVETDSIKLLINAAEQNRGFGILSPFHILPQNDKLEWYFSTYISPEKCRNLYSDIYFNRVENIYEVEFINAAAWIITRTCLLEVGGFDPLFPHYGEDEDYCERVLYKKYKIGIVPSSKIFHDITYRSWDSIKFNVQRQLILSFIELKKLKFTYKFALFNYTKTRIDKLIFLLFTSQWKELFFMMKILVKSYRYIFQIKKSRKISKESFSYLK